MVSRVEPHLFFLPQCVYYFSPAVEMMFQNDRIEWLLLITCVPGKVI
jgi:hypothetical protein